MKRAFSTLCCLERSPYEILSLARDHRMDAVELRVDDRMLAEMTDAESIGTAFSNSGVFICDVASSIFVRGRDVQEHQYGYVDLARALGSPAVRVFASFSPATADGDFGDVYGIAEGIKRLCDYAKPLGIEIWLETHSEMSTGRMCRQVLSLANEENLKVLWDVMHSLEHGESIEETIEILGGDIAHVHLKDGLAPENEKKEYDLCDLGIGEFPFEKVCAALDGAGYSGYLSLEWESLWCPAIRDLYPDTGKLLDKYNEILDKAGVK